MSAIMLSLCASIQDKSVSYDRDRSLDTPNIYFCSVYPFVGNPIHTYLAADHTAVVMQKVSNWCVDVHGFRPYRSNCTIKVRRLRLGDIIENPNSYCQALARAKDQCESDIVTELRKWPGMIAAIVGVPMPAVNAKAAAEIWDALSVEVSRTLRQA